KRETDHYLSQVTEKTCQTCFMKDRCWKEQFDKTYSLMESIKDGFTTSHEPSNRLIRQFENYCVKSKKVMDTMKEELSYFEANRKFKQQSLESKRLGAQQLHGVSEVTDDFEEEIVKEHQYNDR